MRFKRGSYLLLAKESLEGKAVADETSDVVPASSGVETTLDVISFVSSAIPWVGGPISNVLSGVSFGRRLSRVREVLVGLIDDLQGFKSEVSETYVKTEEFEELLERTLRQAAEERNEEKRCIYRRFLVGAIKSPGEPYDELLRFLRVLEEIQPDHLRVLHALLQNPNVNLVPGLPGSPSKTLSKRLPDILDARIEDLVGQLNDMRLTDLTRMRTTMTAHGSQNLHHTITPFGQRFLKFILDTKA